VHNQELKHMSMQEMRGDNEMTRLLRINYTHLTVDP